jgi:hypothetical protein
MKGSTVFSKMDLNEGFYNIQVAEKDRYKTAFRCRYGHFEFNVMPMGLANAPAVFQAMMNRIFRELIDISVICYMDDILVYSATLVDHERDLEAVFQLIRKHQLKLKATKCQLYKREIDFCGHTLNREGIKISSSKVEAMQFTPEFRSVKDVRAYIGTLVWFHNFIPDYAALTQPLTKLLVKDTPFVWGQEQQDAVTILQHKLITAPVLRYYDHMLETRVFSDASKYAIGGYIEQRHADGWHPIVYWSKKMTVSELNYTVHEKETLALVGMVQRYAYWLQPLKFRIFTDHKSLEYLQTQETLTGRQVRWLIILQDFDMVIEYVKGELNNVADLLSRSPNVQPLCGNCQGTIKVSSSQTTGRSLKDRILAAAPMDELWQKLEAWEQTGPMEDKDRKVFQQFLYLCMELVPLPSRENFPTIQILRNNWIKLISTLLTHICHIFALHFVLKLNFQVIKEYSSKKATIYLMNKYL